MEAISVFLLMLQSVLVALGDFKKNGLPQSDAIESVAAEAGFKDEFLKTGIFYLAVGVILVPILALRMFRGKQKLGNPSKISVSKVKKVLYRSYPEAVAASALCMSYFIAESIGCIYREDTYYKCTDVIASNSAFSILFVVGVIHKGFVEPFGVISNDVGMMTLNIDFSKQMQVISGFFASTFCLFLYASADEVDDLKTWYDSERSRFFRSSSFRYKLTGIAMSLVFIHFMTLPIGRNDDEGGGGSSARAWFALRAKAILGTTNPLEFAPAVRFSLIVFSAGTFLILAPFLYMVVREKKKKASTYAGLVDSFWFLLFSSVCLFTMSRPRGSRKRAAFAYILLPAFTLSWSVGLVWLYTVDPEIQGVEPLRKAGMVLLICVLTVVFFPVHELAARYLIDFMGDEDIQKHLLSTFQLALSIFGPCIFLVSESGTCVMTKSLSSCQVFTKTSTVVETHLLLALVFIQSFGFLFKRKTLSDIAHLENIKLHELFIWGSFTVNSVLTAIVFGMRPRDSDDYNLESSPNLTLDPDPTAIFANGVHYFIIFSWIVVLWLESLYLKAINMRQIRLSNPSVNVDDDEIDNDTDDDEGDDETGSTTTSVSPKKESPRSFIKRQFKKARSALRAAGAEDEPVIARAHQWFLLVLAASKPMLSLITIITRALGYDRASTIIGILVGDLFEISGVACILYIFCDLREGKKYKCLFAAMSVPGGQVLELISRHLALRRSFFSDLISIRILIYAVLSAYISSRMYRTMLNVIQDVPGAKLKKIVANVVFGSMFTYLPPLLYIAMEHVSCVWRLHSVEPMLFERMDVWDTKVICVSSFLGCKALNFHIAMTGMFTLNFSPQWQDPHRGYFLTLEKIITLKMKVTETVIFIAYVIATFTTLFVYGTRDRGWGDIDLIEAAVKITRLGELPPELGPNFPDTIAENNTNIDYFLYFEYATWVFIFSFQYYVGGRNASLAKKREQSVCAGSALQVCKATTFTLDNGGVENNEGVQHSGGNMNGSGSPLPTKTKRKKRLTAKFDPPTNVEMTSKEKRLEVGNSKSIWEGGTKGMHRSSSSSRSSASSRISMGSQTSRLSERTSQQGRGTVFGKSMGLESELDHVVEEDEEEDHSNFMDKTGFTLGPGIV
ncbi:hypothetical protein TrVE_jg494 [Triparma verrucosa]|uniref:Uncharacterized protein n=1 Tax=Triparma verrucosa TaxID=1606542 RepID=A0A9W7BN71_9STRA|nr:hypothetical protein TrVE_jg494 [Triparma verrucosa]